MPPWNNFYTAASPPAHGDEQRGIDSWSNERDRHSNSIITTLTIESALNILYLHFGPGLGLSSRTLALMCRITAQRTIRIENKRASAQMNDKSINFQRGKMPAALCWVADCKEILRKNFPREAPSPPHLHEYNSDAKTQESGGGGGERRGFCANGRFDWNLKRTLKECLSCTFTQLKQPLSCGGKKKGKTN